MFLALHSSKAGQAEQRAVKMLRSGASAQDKADFLREAETMMALGAHPHIVEIVGVSVLHRPWLVVLTFCQYGASMHAVPSVLKRMCR